MGEVHVCDKVDELLLYTSDKGPGEAVFGGVFFPPPDSTPTRWL